MTKRDKAIIEFYGLSIKSFQGLYAIVLDFDFFNDSWNEIHAENAADDKLRYSTK